MANNNIYGVYNTLSNQFVETFVAPTDLLASRMFCAKIGMQNEQINKRYQGRAPAYAFVDINEFRLYNLGELDEESIKIKALEVGQNVSLDTNYKKDVEDMKEKMSFKESDKSVSEK